MGKDWDLQGESISDDGVGVNNSLTNAFSNNQGQIQFFKEAMLTKVFSKYNLNYTY